MTILIVLFCMLGVILIINISSFFLLVYISMHHKQSLPNHTPSSFASKEEMQEGEIRVPQTSSGESQTL